METLANKTYPKKHIPQFANPDHGWKYMIAMGLMVAGIQSVDKITDAMIPLTTRHFTDNAAIIAFIVSLTRLFGFIVQPYVAWKSDRVNTRFGRRRPFFLIGIPLTLVSLLAVGAFPLLFKGELRLALPVLIAFIAFNVLLQMVQDVNWGGIPPLYADTFPQQRLGSATSFRTCSVQVMSLFMTLYALKLAVTHEFFAYICSAALLFMSFLVIAFVIREKPITNVHSRERYNPVKHLGMLLQHADYMKLAIIGALLLTLNSAFTLYLSLFVTRTLNLSTGQLGYALSGEPILILLLAVPLGYFVDRLGPKWIMATGFFLYAASALSMVYLVKGYHSLICVIIFRAFAALLIDLPFISLVFQYASKTERGTVFGLIQYVRGITAFSVTMLIGFVVQQTYSHDPTPLYPEDLKHVKEFSIALQKKDNPVGQFIYGNLSEETHRALESLQVKTNERIQGGEKNVSEKVISDLNRLIKQPNLYNQERFSGVSLSHHTVQELEKRSSRESDLIIVNRNLLHEAFPDYISKKVDYRISFFMCVVLALMAGLVTLTTKRGKYAATIQDTLLEGD